MTTHSPSAVTIHQPIRLLGRKLTADVFPDRVYFAFGSGRLTYDCVSCGAKCCHGHGYLLNQDVELERQLARSPSVALFFERGKEGEGANQYLVKNCPSGCFFLTSSGMCGVQIDHGYDAKPETCRLFPFNNLRWLDGYLIVRPHPNLCPLEIVGGKEVNKRSEHHELLEAMCLKPIQNGIDQCETSYESPGAAIAAERRIVALSEEFLAKGDYLSFTVAQTAAVGQSTVKGMGEKTGEDVHRYAADVCRLLRIPGTVFDNDHVSRTMIAMTPYLRSQLVFSDCGAAASGARIEISVERVPLALLSLYLIVSTAASIGPTAPHFQTVTRLYDDFLPLLILFAHLHDSMVWHAEAPVPFPAWDSPDLQRRYMRIIRALQPGPARKRPARLYDILHEHAMPEDADGLIFLKELARGLFGHLKVHGNHNKWTERVDVRVRIQSAIHRWALGHIDEGVLGSLYARTRNHRGNSAKARDAGASVGGGS
ncbi:MAG: YkgJ family cysteine cluster protein [Gemmatimonadales bacterium]|nr:YkgJ family cysteine cluster protein [Gemmatimonadales bacterium]